MGDAAAFFDLDRTILAGASGTVITAELRAAGLLTGPSIPGTDLMFRVFGALGETRPAMFVTRQGARLAAGWARSEAQAVGERVADTLVDEVQPFARILAEEHQAAGRKVVLATTTPYDLVRPLADRLGFDDVVATRYGEDDGVYDGTIDGEFVWSRGKLRAVREWAGDHDVSVADSWAYSDSYYDIPLLAAVGHPTAVNPDPRLRVVATLRRWPTRYLDVPEGVVKVVGREPQELLSPFARSELVPFADIRIAGTDNIPASGAAIVASNHRSYFDPLVLGYVMADRGRPVRFLGKKEVFDAPIIGQMAKAVGGIRVDRGTGGDEPLKAAAEALEAGEVVVILPQGTIPRGSAFFEPELQGRWGIARLAHMTHAPVVPIGLWGTEAVWPRSSRLPNVLNILDRPVVTATVGPRVDLGYADADADTKTIMAAIVALLPPEARERQDPTSEELAATFPPGYEGDPDAEVDRRPGTD